MGEKRKKEVKLDEFHYHEALDRSYMVADIMEVHLINHVVFEKHKHLKEKLEKAQELICEVYQELGGLEIILFTDPSKLPDFMTDGDK